jgi:hypothetical protein
MGFTSVQEVLSKLGYDGIDVTMRDGRNEIVVFDPAQIKSAEAVTYDDAGNVIPPSQRFDLGSTDMRYQQAQRGPRGPKGSIRRAPDNKLLVKIFESADFTTFTHEFFHAFEMLGFPGWTDAEVETYQRWAGYTTFGRNAKPTGKAREKGARGWERYLAEGKAPLVELQELFDKIAKWMLETYKSLSNRNIDVEITPEIRAMFDKLAARMVNPTVITTPSGVEMSTDDGSSLPPAIDPASDTPIETVDQIASAIRHIIENPIPVGIPVSQDTPLDADWNPEGLFSLQRRRADEEAAKYRFDTETWNQGVRSFGDNWERVTNEPAGTGEAFLVSYLEEANPDRVLTDLEVARLTHEGLRRKKAVDTLYDELQKAIATKNADYIAEKQSMLDQALTRYQTVQNVAAGARTASGRALNAWKYALRNDFTYATLQSRTLSDLNAVRVANGKDPLAALPAAQEDAVREFSAKMLELQQQVRDLRDRMVSQDAATEAQIADQEAQIAQQEAQIAQLIAERDAALKNIKVTDATKKVVVKRVKQAAADARARLGVILPEGDIRYQFDSASDPTWQDRVIVMAEPLLVKPDMSDARFAELVEQFFGSQYAAVAEQLRDDARAYLNTAYQDLTGANIATPEEVMSSIDEEMELTHDDVYALAKAHVYAGARENEVITRTHADLVEVFPDLTREDVAQLFTNYGVTREVNTSEEAEALRAAKSLELVQRQIDDLEATGQIKRTGAKKDEPSDALRALRKKRDDLAKAIGYVPRDPETNLSSAQSAARKRMQNEIRDLEKALRTGTPRVRVRRGVEYTEDMKELQGKLASLRETYEQTFGQERTPEERMKRVVADLDRRIAKERDLIKKGMLAEPTTVGPVLESPEITARRELLKSLRQQKLEAYDALNPNKRALAQAMKEAEAAVKRRQELLEKGLTITKAKRERGEGVTPTEDLMALWEAADAMDVLLREMRKNRPLTPEQQQKKLDAAYKQAIETRDALLEKIANGDLVTTPRKGVTAEQRTRAVRAESAALRKQLTQMQRDAGVGPFSEEAREQKRFDGLTKRLEEIRRKRREKDYSKRKQAEPATSERITQLEIQLERENMKFKTEMAIEGFKELTRSRKALAKLASLYQARQILNLSLDLGVFGRQFGKVQTLALQLDAMSLVKRRLNREKADVMNGTIIGKTLAATYKALLDPTYTEEVYARIQLDPMYAKVKANGFNLISPHESSHEMNSDGKIRINPLHVLDNRLLAGLALAKGVTKTLAVLTTAKATGGVPWNVMKKAIADSVIGGLVLVGGKPIAMRIEAAQNAALNLGRFELAKAASQQLLSNVDTAREPDFERRVTEAVLINTGEVIGKSAAVQLVKNNAGALSYFFNFVKYQVSNLQSVMMTPLFRAVFENRGDRAWRKQTMQALSIIVAHQYATYAFRAAMLAAMLGVWDEDDKESEIGMVMNPKHPHFMKLKIGRTYIDLAAGWSAWVGRLLNVGSDTELDRDALRSGREVEVKKTAFGKSGELGKFIQNRLHSNIRTLWNFGVARSLPDGTDLDKMDFPNSFDLLLDDVTTNLMARDSEKILKAHSGNPAQAATILQSIFTGANVSFEETWKEVSERKRELNRRYQSGRD